MKNKNIKLSLIKKMIFLMSYKQKIYLIQLFLLMILSSLLELISIGMILPILNILTNNNNQSEIFKFIEKFILPVNYNNDVVIIYLFIFFYYILFVKNSSYILNHLVQRNLFRRDIKIFIR